MDRWDWLWVKLVALPAALVGVGTAGALGVRHLATSVQIAGQPLFGAVAPLAPWILFGSVLIASGLLADRLYRLWRYERGHGPICRHCGGPLGPEWQARWSALRGCLLCGRLTGDSFYGRC